MSVISSFTEHNLHQNLNPMVPSVLINSSMIQICIYDCVDDILLITSEIQFVNLDQAPPVLNIPAM